MFLLSGQIKTYVSHFSLESSSPFPNFVKWCVRNYSKSERVIMNANGSKILFQIDANTIKEALGPLETCVSESEQFIEEEFTRFYRETNDE